MKHLDEACITPIKRQPNSSIFDITSLQRFPSDLHNDSDDFGYISGCVFMTWPSNGRKKKILFKICTSPDSTSYACFEVVLAAECLAAFLLQGLELGAKDELSLDLEGGTIFTDVDKPRASGALPIRLEYSTGIRMKVIKSHRAEQWNGRVLDTWLWDPDSLSANVRRDTFGTPASQADLPSTPQTPKLIKSDSPTPLAGRKRPRASTVSTDTPIPPKKLKPDIFVEDIEQKEPRKLTKKEKKALRAQQRNNRLASGVHDETQSPPRNDASRDSSSKSESSSNAIGVVPVESDNSKAVSLGLTSAANTNVSREELLESEIPIKAPIEGPLAMTAGLYSGDTRYTALKQATKGTKNIIGVVCSVDGPSKKPFRDWSCSMTMIDPSVCSHKDGSLTHPHKYSVNCFTKAYEQWLPHPEVNDVVILRGVKLTEFNGSPSAIGYHDSLQWAVYKPETRKMDHNRGSAPLSVRLGQDGTGAVFSPFHDARPQEIAYCSKLAAWWRAVLEKRREELGTVHQIGGGVPEKEIFSAGSKRQHRLICDAGPSVPPNGYFDCTVEVLYGYASEAANQPYDIYVTDYTKNEQLTPVQYKWCPSTALAETVLRIQLWDGARELGTSMQTGVIYSMKNVRMRVSKGGYLEAKIQEAKIQPLDEKEAEHNVHLREFLERKTRWQSNDDNVEPQPEYDLIQDAKPDEFFSCIVELIHATFTDEAFIYVSDYTCLDILPRFDDPWAAGLEHGIIRIKLTDGQVEMAKRFEVGTILSIKNLRLRKSYSEKIYQGLLGGNQRLIEKLTDGNLIHADMKGQLSGRKVAIKNGTAIDSDTKPTSKPMSAEFELEVEPKIESATVKEIGESIIKPEAKSLTRQARKSAQSPHDLGEDFKSYQRATISEMQACTRCPHKFRLKAKAVSYFPKLLQDCVITRCTRCNIDLPSKYRKCIACDIDDQALEYQYRLFLRLSEENGGNDLMVAVTNEGPFLKHLKRVNLCDDRDAFLAFLDTVEPFLGNLGDVQEGREIRKKLVEPFSPTLDFMIETWKNVRGDKVYELRAYLPVA
ncbi:hypothetical protein EDD18DRAFT_1253386 [Armillaria luteobubalina]|uniref:Telomeric single stranded DNA binding POT1/Cdc13 domain-containing protein n=1 Tax=Armillaria luteobubalina TaxID=153913 RepID=A0AA39Q6A2_9AGAR|nr:hypothetical protein EDD18DRAFT_1253386 [Armillaria luteobubalina]